MWVVRIFIQCPFHQHGFCPLLLCLISRVKEIFWNWFAKLAASWRVETAPHPHPRFYQKSFYYSLKYLVDRRTISVFLYEDVIAIYKEKKIIITNSQTTQIKLPKERRISRPF